MTTPEPHRVGATTSPAAAPVDLDVDLRSLDTMGLKELQHRVEGELARIEPSEPPGANQGQLDQHGSATLDPDRSRGLRALLIAIDDQVSGRTDTPEDPTGE